MSFPKGVGQCPIYYNRMLSGRPNYKPDGGWQAFANGYLDCGSRPLFFFGEGLSYTSFEYESMTLDTHELTEDSSITVTVRLKNTGDHDGKEVVQLYMHDKVSSAVRPVQELLAFKKVFIKAGESVDEAAFAAGKKKFTDALDNDLNTSLAVTALYDVFKLKTNDKTKLALVESFETVLDLGLLAAAKRVNDEKAKAEASEYADVDPELLAYIKERIEARKAAKKAKNFAEADAIRDELLEKGITILDTREGTKFTIN
jgi:hypothetical protein